MSSFTCIHRYNNFKRTYIIRQLSRLVCVCVQCLQCSEGPSATFSLRTRFWKTLRERWLSGG